MHGVRITLDYVFEALELKPGEQLSISRHEVAQEWVLSLVTRIYPNQRILSKCSELYKIHGTPAQTWRMENIKWKEV